MFDPKKIRGLKVLVLGDVMLDSYFFGKVDRISPEAPVPVVAVQRKENRLGGAANVALNLKALGAEPILCSVTGKDEDGKLFRKLLRKHKIDDSGIIESLIRITTVKTRVIGNNHQILRVDHESILPLNQTEEKLFLQMVAKLLPSADVVIFEDYDKGLLTANNISAIIELATKQKIPTVVDPKKLNFMSYKGATLFKPNLKELREGLKTDHEIRSLEEIRKAAHQLQKKLDVQIVMVTLSEGGIFICDKKKHYHIPAHIRKIADVSGAGDTVISVAAICLALKLPIQQIAEISNLAGGLVCEEVGVVPINLQKLIKELPHSVSTYIG